MCLYGIVVVGEVKQTCCLKYVKFVWCFFIEILFKVPLIFKRLKLSHNLYDKVNNMKKTIQFSMKSVIKINIKIRMKASRMYIYNTFPQKAFISMFLSPGTWMQMSAFWLTTGLSFLVCQQVGRIKHRFFQNTSTIVEPDGIHFEFLRHPILFA